MRIDIATIARQRDTFMTGAAPAWIYLLACNAQKLFFYKQIRPFRTAAHWHADRTAFFVAWAIEVTKTDARREWSIAKSKDDETGAAHAFKLEVVPLGFDDDGEEITSCVALPDNSKEIVSRVKLPQGGNQ